MTEETEVFIAGRIDPKLFGWVKSKIEDRTFGSQSHAVERGLLLLKEKYEQFEIKKVKP